MLLVLVRALVLVLTLVLLVPLLVPPCLTAQPPRARRNVRPDGVGDQIGRLHLESQDLNKLALRRFKSFKGAGKAAAAEGAVEGGAAAGE